MAEQVMRRTARQRENRLDALPPNLAGRLNGLRDYEFMDDAARDAFNALTDELAAADAADLLPGAEGGRRARSRRRTWTACATWCAT